MNWCGRWCSPQCLAPARAGRPTAGAAGAVHVQVAGQEKTRSGRAGWLRWAVVRGSVPTHHKLLDTGTCPSLDIEHRSLADRHPPRYQRPRPVFRPEGNPSRPGQAQHHPAHGLALPAWRLAGWAPGNQRSARPQASVMRCPSGFGRAVRHQTVGAAAVVSVAALIGLGTGCAARRSQHSSWGWACPDARPC